MHATTLQQLHKEKENVLTSMENTKTIILAKQDSIAKIHSKAKLLHEKGEEFSKQNQSEDLKITYAISLYSKISNITWDYDAPSDHLAGCTFEFRCAYLVVYIHVLYIDIGHENTKDYESFDIHLNSLTATEVADFLWDKIAAGVQRNVS